MLFDCDCSTVPASTGSNAGLAGAGILLAFIITAVLALAISSFIVLSEYRASSPHPIARKVLGGLSDQHIVQGIGIQLLGLAKMNTIVPYHFFIIWMLAILSTATNFASLLALVEDLKRDWVLRWMRQVAMFVNFAFTVVFGIFLLESKSASLSATLPIACVWKIQGTSGTESFRTPVTVAGTIAVITASGIVFLLATWYLHMRKQRWGFVVRAVCLLALVAIAIASAVRVMLVSQAFGSPSVKLEDEGEKEWDFGQLLTMLLLILPFISALEIVRGEMQVPKADMKMLC